MTLPLGLWNCSLRIKKCVRNGGDTRIVLITRYRALFSPRMFVRMRSSAFEDTKGSVARRINTNFCKKYETFRDKGIVLSRGVSRWVRYAARIGANLFVLFFRWMSVIIVEKTVASTRHLLFCGKFHVHWYVQQV